MYVWCMVCHLIHVSHCIYWCFWYFNVEQQKNVFRNCKLIRVAVFMNGNNASHSWRLHACKPMTRNGVRVWWWCIAYCTWRCTIYSIKRCAHTYVSLHSAKHLKYHFVFVFVFVSRFKKNYTSHSSYQISKLCNRNGRTDEREIHKWVKKRKNIMKIDVYFMCFMRFVACQCVIVYEENVCIYLYDDFFYSFSFFFFLFLSIFTSPSYTSLLSFFLPHFIVVNGEELSVKVRYIIIKTLARLVLLWIINSVTHI